MLSASLLQTIWRALLRPLDAKLGLIGWRGTCTKRGTVTKRSASIKRITLTKRNHIVVNRRALDVVVAHHRQSCSLEI